MIAEAYFR